MSPLERPRLACRGLAVCPLCGNEALVRQRCWFCYELGFVPREIRNAYKLGAIRRPSTAALGKPLFSSPVNRSAAQPALWPVDGEEADA